MNSEELPTNCKNCGKLLDVVEIFFGSGYCDLCKRKAAQAHQRRICAACAVPLASQHAHFIHGLYYCDEHIPPSS